MTAPSRRQKIEAMLADDPQDQFLRYSLDLTTYRNMCVRDDGNVVTLP